MVKNTKVEKVLTLVPLQGSVLVGDDADLVEGLTLFIFHNLND